MNRSYKETAMGILLATSVVACGQVDQDVVGGVAETSTLRAAVPAGISAPRSLAGVGGSLIHPEFVRKLADISKYQVNEWTLLHESICGTTSLQYVNSYDGRLGVSRTFVNQHKNPVGAMTDSANPAASKYCSGTLIGPNVFLTASHCIGTDTVGQYVVMNYERAAGSTTLLPQEFFRIKDVSVEGALAGIDYGILLLDGSPGLKYGWATMLAEDPSVGDRLAIIQHPNGDPKQVDAGSLGGISGDYLTYSNVDTQPGSSGSGILNGDGNLVGVHTNGGCSGTGGANSGVRMEQIVETVAFSRLL